MSTILKKKLLRKSGLYLIIDRQTLKDKDILAIISYVLKAGVDIIQYRDKLGDAIEIIRVGRTIKDFLKSTKKDSIFIINDRVDIALAVDSDGVHLGQCDVDVQTARRILGKEKIIGLSTHSISEIQSAVNKDVDYISIGPIFPTETKPDYKPVGLELIRKGLKEVNRVRQWSLREVSPPKVADDSAIPIVAVGGINKSNIADVIQAGANRVAVVRAVLSSRDPYTAVKEMMQVIKKVKSQE